MDILNKNYYVKRYSKENEQEWDDFIFDSINGTFLQSRRFLNYHPKDRFIDDSLLIYDKKNHLSAICPACTIMNNNHKIFFSHKGSTFGGIIFNKMNYSVHKVIEIMEVIEEYLEKNSYKEVVLKITPDIFSKEKSELLQYVLYYLGYEDKKELSLYIDYGQYNDDIYKNLAQGKRTDINNCKKVGMKLKHLNSKDEIRMFYNILCENLQKYNAKPVHTIEELIDFKNDRLKNEVEFWGIEYEAKIVAGAMLFLFNNINVMHTQYLCALNEYSKLSPMSFLYYELISMCKSQERTFLSWGGTTEDNGKYLNYGLAKSKEAFGSKYSINHVFTKSFS